MWQSWRTYFCFVLVGAIFLVSQMLSGGTGGRETDGVLQVPRDRGYHDAGIETSGRGAISLSGDSLLMLPAPQAAAADRQQTD